VPVNVTNCNNIGAISLALNYNPALLTFDGYQSPNSALSVGTLVVNSTGSKVILTWASSVAANIGNGVLIQFKFRGNASVNTSVSWDTQTPGYCEYSNLTGSVITSFFVNGSITIASNALVVNAGNDVVISPGNNTQLNGTVTGGSAPFVYLWSPSTGLSNPAIVNPVANPAATTNYTFTVTGSNSCVANDQVKVFVMKMLNLHVLLEGLYNSSGTMRQAYDASGPHFGAGIADQITIELHNSANYSVIAYTSALTNLSTSGNSTINIPVEYSASYYITVRNRNHIVTTSATPVSFSGSSITYNFDVPAKAYGNNLKITADGQYVIFGGDVNQDRLIDAGDMIPVDNLSATFGTGYVAADVNGDGSVNETDMNLLFSNSNNFVGAITP
jgi:hypothetical protein